LSREKIEKIKELVKKKLEGEGSGHDWLHIERVYKTAMDIAEKESETQKVDLTLVELGALLHDIADHKFGYSDEDRKKIIEDILKDLYEEDIVMRTIEIVNGVSYKNGKNRNKLTTIEGLIVQDADRLDAMGSIGIARAFSYGGSKSRLIYDSPTKDDTINHFYEKLLLLKDLMNTKSGKEKAINRHRIMEEFLKNFYLEIDGKL